MDNSKVVNVNPHCIVMATESDYPIINVNKVNDYQRRTRLGTRGKHSVYRFCGNHVIRDKGMDPQDPFADLEEAMESMTWKF